MTVSPTLQKYLDQSVTYDLIPHAPTLSSTRTAEACHVPGEALAKAVVLRRDGGYMMAVLPASHHLHLSALKRHLGHKVDLASEEEIERLFDDCDAGPYRRSANATGWTSSSTTASMRDGRSTWKAAITPR